MTQLSLITTDVGDTLGEFTGPSVKDTLYQLSRIPETAAKAAIIGEEERRFLHTTPELTDRVIWNLCHALLIDRRQWPDPWPRGGFQAYSYTNRLLAQLCTLAPIAALSNISILGSTRMDDLAEQCGHYVRNIYTSYDMGRRKPDLTLWLDIADVYGIPADEIVHIGDRWVNDICGAVDAGARAIYLTGTRQHLGPIPLHDFSPNQVAVVNDLRDVPAVLRAWGAPLNQ